MLINQVSKVTGLTKKAIEYYTIQKLIAPAILGNGYRDYRENDCKRLQKIAVLRQLDISTEEIKEVLEDPSNTTLQVIGVRKELNVQRETAKKMILDKLSKGAAYTDVQAELQALAQSKTITEKILESFPGYYGRFLCLHFAPFFQEPMQTEEQREAFRIIVSFLDQVPTLEFPQDLQEYLIENTKHLGVDQITDMIAQTRKSLDHPDDFLLNNREVLTQYWEYKQSEEYKNSPAFKLAELLKEFNSTSGYYDVFIPALKRVSQSYAAYYQKLEVANEKLMMQYPECT